MNAQRRLYEKWQYCENCTCAGCVIHRDRIREFDAARVQQEQFMQALDPSDLDPLLRCRPGGAISLDACGRIDLASQKKAPEPDKMGVETDDQVCAPEEKRFRLNDWIPWKFLMCVAVAAVAMQFFVKACGRVV